MELVTMTAALGRYFQTTEGLLVVRAPEQPAIDIEDGDVILTISGRTPNSPEHAIRILGSFEPGEQVEFELMRDGRREAIEYLVPSAQAVVVPVPPDAP
jgi:S1-C subfamily serine protease